MPTEIEAGDTTLPGDGRFPAILVAHENRGLTDYIRDVTRRLAKTGYVALAAPSQIPATLSRTSPDELAGYYLSDLAYLRGLPECRRTVWV